MINYQAQSALILTGAGRGHPFHGAAGVYHLRGADTLCRVSLRLTLHHPCLSTTLRGLNTPVKARLPALQPGTG